MVATAMATVGAIDRSNVITSFSGTGPAVDLVAPGVALYSAWLGTSYKSLNGTSQAAPVRDERLLWQVVSAGFAQRRKTILNNLRNAPSPLQEIVKLHGGASIVLCQAEVDLQRRAETLTLEEWARVSRALE